MQLITLKKSCFWLACDRLCAIEPAYQKTTFSKINEPYRSLTGYLFSYTHCKRVFQKYPPPLPHRVLFIRQPSFDHVEKRLAGDVSLGILRKSRSVRSSVVLVSGAHESMPHPRCSHISISRVNSVRTRVRRLFEESDEKSLGRETQTRGQVASVFPVDRVDLSRVEWRTRSVEYLVSQSVPPPRPLPADAPSGEHSSARVLRGTRTGVTCKFRTVLSGRFGRSDKDKSAGAK